MFIAHICCGYNIMANTIHYAINITITEAKLFAIRYEINQAIYITNILYIIIITDTIYLAKKIFDSSIYPY